MNRFLRPSDFQRLITADNLNQLTESDDNLLVEAERMAIAEMTTYLSQRYDVDRVFSGLTTYQSGATYYADSLVESGSTLYYALKPADEWTAGQYHAGDVVFFKDRTWTACTSTAVVPGYSSDWSAGDIYSFTGIPPTDSDYWVQGDNRNAVIMMYCIDIALYHLNARLNPNDIPITRVVRYNGGDKLSSTSAIGWLKAVASGDLDANLPELIPFQGRSIRWGRTSQQDTSTY